MYNLPTSVSAWFFEKNMPPYFNRVATNMIEVFHFGSQTFTLVHANHFEYFLEVTKPPPLFFFKKINF
jgi:hypothetical protein